MKKHDLVKIFAEAVKNNAEYTGVCVETVGMPHYEIIINKYENLDKKLEYYINNYTDDLVLKTFDGVKIVRAGYANNLREMEEKLGL